MSDTTLVTIILLLVAIYTLPHIIFAIKPKKKELLLAKKEAIKVSLGQRQKSEEDAFAKVMKKASLLTAITFNPFIFLVIGIVILTLEFGIASYPFAHEAYNPSAVAAHHLGDNNPTAIYLFLDAVNDLWSHNLIFAFDVVGGFALLLLLLTTISDWQFYRRRAV
jgi:hypothetical protein